MSVDYRYSIILLLIIDYYYYIESEVKIIGPDLHAPDYHIIGTDLRNLAELEKIITQSGIHFDIPTMFLTECVLVYMEPESSSMLLHWIAKKFDDIFFINYEQVQNCCLLLIDTIFYNINIYCLGEYE